VALEHDELSSSVGLDFQARLDNVAKLTTDRLVNGSSCDEIDMDIVAKFCGPSRWKELSKETSSKILPCGDGSCWKTFNVTPLFLHIAAEANLGYYFKVQQS
ncbi:hypothetical protein Tco_0262850, partial [Tanacetum coccineum]